MVNPKSEQDQVYAKALENIDNFTFDDRVAEVFPDMIQRSVPGYETMIHMLGKLTERFSRPDANYYDLGCSLGAATLAMRRNIQTENGTIFAVDNSEAMLERCKNHVNAFNFPTPVNFALADINDYPISNAAIVVLNFTLQFLSPVQRQDLVSKIYRGLRSGGLLFISEKLTFSDSVIDDLLIELHHDFKKDNGYSELEISQKRSALENVMLTDSFETHQLRFHQAGFEHVSLWYQNMNFSSMLAIKAK